MSHRTALTFGEKVLELIVADAFCCSSQIVQTGEKKTQASRNIHKKPKKIRLFVRYVAVVSRREYVPLRTQEEKVSVA